MESSAISALSPGRRIRVGVDIVGVDRVARLAAENEGILETLFTGRELSYCLGRRRCYEHLAARFAAKEAVLKAFGTGICQRMRWTDVEVVNETSGRPRVSLYGEVAAWAERRGLADLDVSLSHTAGLAIAQAVTVWDQPEVSHYRGAPRSPRGVGSQMLGDEEIPSPTPETQHPAPWPGGSRALSPD